MIGDLGGAETSGGLVSASLGVHGKQTQKPEECLVSLRSERDSQERSVLCENGSETMQGTVEVGGAEAGARASGRLSDDVFFRSSVVESINALKNDIAVVRAEIKNLKGSGARQLVPAVAATNRCCFLYVRILEGGGSDGCHVGKTRLEQMLGCQVCQYTCVREFPSPSFKAKIAERDSRGAIDTGRKSGCFVDIWRISRVGSSVAGQRVADGGTQGGRVAGSQGRRQRLQMTSWNCRGLSNSLPYLEALMAEGSKVLVLSEHWLWPYDLDKLKQISEEYDVVGKADVRLSDKADGRRGFGGVGILWHKSIGATPIGGISSDRICGIRFSVDDGDASVMSVIGVYLPCLDQGMDCYREHLIELDRVVSESEHLGPVVVLGDFNAHLGRLGGGRGAGDPNVQGVLLQEFMERSNLSAVSLGCIASGPVYTYCSGDVHTTVDYVLADVEATSLMSSCHTHPMTDLNTSDHLPQSVTFMYDACAQDAETVTDGLPRIDWDQARKTGMIDEFTNAVQGRLGPLLNNSYIDSVQMSEEIGQVAEILTAEAVNLLPHVQPRKKTRWRDETLSCLCAQSCAARKAWKEAGRPTGGPLYEEKGRLR